MSLTRCWTSPSIGHNFLLILAITFCLSNVLANNNNNNINNNNNNNNNYSNNYNERGIISSKDFTNVWKDLSNDCKKEEETKNLSVSCQGVRIVRKVVQQFLDKSSKQPNIEIFDGINLVEVNDPNLINTRKGRFLKGFGSMTPLLQFLEGRELRVKLPKLLPANFDAVFENTLNAASSNGEARRGGGGGLGGGGGGYGGGGGGGGGKKGGGGMMILALMMGKMLATMGFGALGLLTLKALMVSGLALMLSIIIAVKKLASGGDDGGGHHVVYAQEVGHHHRKKRSFTNEDENNEILDLPYRGYADLYGDVKVS